jgi:hypothetical protein
MTDVYRVFGAYMSPYSGQGPRLFSAAAGRPVAELDLAFGTILRAAGCPAGSRP